MDESPGSEAAIYRDGTYLERNEIRQVEDSPWKAEHIAAMLMRNNLDPRWICEVGCGDGEILRQLSVRFGSAHFVGYELSPQAFRLCAERASERVSFRRANLADENVHYDCLLCIDVLAHVEDYLGFLRALKRRADYKVFHIPLDLSALSVLRGATIEERDGVGHLHCFTCDTALATLRDCGFEILDSFYTAHFVNWPARTPAAKIERAIRKFVFAVSPDFAARLWGGCSLLVLAR